MKKKVSSAGRRSNKGSSTPFAMRNPVPSSRFHLLAVTLILSTVAVWPIGYTTAEGNSLLSDRKVKKNVHQHGASFITRRSSNFEELKNQHNLQNPDMLSNLYEKFQKGDLVECDDNQYPQQAKLLDSNLAGDADRSYENDGYGYDDDEYDHLNNKRYDSNSDKMNEDVKCGKEESNEGFGKDGHTPVNKKIASGEQDLPKTTIELINFQAKNINSGENFQQNKEEEKAKDTPFKSFSKSFESGKESSSDGKAKKKISSQGVSCQKAEETQSDEKSSEMMSGSTKISGSKDLMDDSVKKVKEKADDNKDVTQEGVQGEKNTVGSSGSKENNININAENMKFGEASKKDAKITEKDCKETEVKIHSEAKEKKNAQKAEDNSERDYESGVTEVKAGNDNAKEDSGEKNLSSDYKECADGMNDAEIFDCERGVEDAKDREENLNRLRNHRSDVQSNVAEHQDMTNSKTSKYVTKKDAVKNLSENKSNSHSCYSALHMNWDSGKESSKNTYEHLPKEPLHLDFPLAELENTDYHRNFIKSLKRYKGIDESSRILNQADTTGSLVNTHKKDLPSKVIDEQRKRRSRLRRLKSNELYNTARKESKSNVYKDRTDKDWGSRAEEMSSGSVEFSDGELKRTGWKEKNRRETYDEWMDPYKKKLILDFEDEETKIDAKNKRQNNVRLYERERSTHARDTKKALDENERLREEIRVAPSKRKFYTANDRNEGNYYYNSQRENYKDTKGIHDDSIQIHAQPFLSQKKDNGEHFTKTFTNGKSETDSEINSKDLVRMLYRDNNYIVLKKIASKPQNILCNQNNGDQTESFRTRSNPAPNAKMLDNYKINEPDMIMKAHSPVSGEEHDFSKIKGTFREELTEAGFDKKENKLKDLSSFFKSRNQQPLQSKNDENKAGATSPEKNMHMLDVYQKSEQQDKSYNAPLSQAYKYIRDFEDSQQSKEMQNQMKDIFTEGQMEISKSTPNERQNYFFADKTLNPREKEFQYAIPNAKIRPDSSVIQLKTPDNAQKGTGFGKYHLHGIGVDNSMPSSPKHELKIMQNDIGLQQDSQPYYNNFNNPQTKIFPNKIMQNLMQPGKMTFSSNAGIPKGGVNPGYPIIQTNNLRNENSMMKQTTLNASTDIKQMQEKTAEIKSNAKRMAKKVNKNYEELEDSGNLERFIRDFQYFADQQNAKNIMIPKTTLRELTEHGDENLQNLNNLLREIMNNRISNAREGKKNPKRGAFQKYKDQNYVPVGIMEINDPQASSGKWTSLVYERPNAYHFDHLDSNSDFREPDKFPSAKKDSLRKLEYEGNVDRLSTGRIDEDNLEAAQNYFIRAKRDFKEITNFSSCKCKVGKEQSATVPHILTEKDNQSGLSPESAKKGKSFPEKETKIFNRNAGVINFNLNKNTLNENRRKLLSISEMETLEDLNSIKKQNAERIRKSLQNYLDSLVQKINDIEYLRNESSAVDAAHRVRRGIVCKVPKCKRELEIDEDRFRKLMSNDIKNDSATTTTTTEGFGKGSCGMIHWESNGGFHDDFDDTIDDVGESENSEMSKKRHLSWKKMESHDCKRTVRSSSDERKSLQEKNIKSDSKKSIVKKATRFDDGTNIKIRIVGGDFTKAYDGANNMNAEGASYLKSKVMDIAEEQDQNSEAGGQIDENRLVEGKNLYDDNPGSNEIYVMDEKQIKRKFSGPKNDQINQKQQYNSHLAQVSMVYNSGMETNRATSSEQDMQSPTKGSPGVIYNYNSSISKLEDDVLANNLKIGNTKVYTYQASEESTPDPREEKVEEAKSKGFERIKMKNKLKTNVIFPSADNHGYYSPDKYLSGYFPDIIYKDDKNQLLTNARKTSGELLSKKKGHYKEEDSNVQVGGNPYRNGNGVHYISMKPYQNTLRQEHPKANPVMYTRNEIGSVSNHGQAIGIKANPSYITLSNSSPKGEEKKEAPEESSFPSGSTSSYEDTKLEIGKENLNPRMIEAWNSYARAQLTPSKLKGLANKEYQNYRKNLDFMIGLEKVEKPKENVKQSKEDVRMSRNVAGNSENLDSDLIKSPQKTDSDRLPKKNSDVYPEQLPNQKKNNEKGVVPLRDEKSKKYPVKVGKRFFYSFRSEVPDEYSNFLNAARANKEAKPLVKESESVDKKFEKANFNPELIPKKESEPGEMSEEISDSNILRNAKGSHVGKTSLEADDGKSSMENTLAARRYGEAKLTDSASSASTSKLREKRWSSGHLTESHYRKYHKKNFNRKRETFDKRKIEVESCTAQEDVIRAKRDTFDEAVRADMERRMQEEREVRDMLNYFDMNKKLPLALSPGSTVAEVNDESRETESKISKVSESDAMRTAQEHTYTKTEDPTLYKSHNIRNGRNTNLMESRHTIVSRSQPEKYEDEVFMKGLKVRKATKFSDEGFERLTPDVRFSEKGKVNYYVQQNSNGIIAPWMQMPFNVRSLDNMNQGCGTKDHSGHGSGENFGATRYSGNENPGMMGIGYYNNDYPRMIAYNKNYYSEAENNGGYNGFSGMTVYSKKYNNRKMEENQSPPDKGNAPENAPKQKLVHALSHEAPLLTATNFINQPTGHGNVQDATINVDLEKTTDTKQSSFTDFPNEADMVVSFQPLSDSQLVRGSSSWSKGSQQTPLVKPNLEDSRPNEPVMGAVVLLAKTRQQNKRQAQDQLINKLGKRNAVYFVGNKCPDWCSTGSKKNLQNEGTFYGEKVANRGRLGAKRRPQARESKNENKDSDSYSKVSDQVQGTVNDSAGSGTCVSDGDIKTCSTEKSNNFKQPLFTFSQSQNIKTDTRNVQKDNTANCGEQILEAILGRVESNPRFRKIIGPGLKLRAKEETDKEARCGQSNKCHNNDVFILKLRKIMVKFMCDIEKLAEQKPKKSCSKLDCEINQFLREMLEASCGNQERSASKLCRAQAEPILRTHCMSKPCSNGDQNGNAKVSLKDQKKKHNFIMKLLAEYQNLSQSDKKKVEEVGKYLEQQLEELKVSMTATTENETINGNKVKVAEDKNGRDMVTERKLSEDKTTEKKCAENLSENKCPEEKDTDNKNTIDSSNQTEWPKEKQYFEKNANNTCPEANKTLETKTSEEKTAENKNDKNKSSKEDKNAENKNEDRKGEDKAPKNESSKEKNIENTNTEDKTNKSNTADKSCNKTKSFEKNTAPYKNDEAKNSESGYTEDNKPSKSGTGGYPENNIAEENNETKKKCKSQYIQEAVSHPRKGQNVHSGNAPISTRIAMQNINDVSPSVPFVWYSLDDVNLLKVQRPKPRLLNYHKNQKYQLERGQSSSSLFPFSKENVPSKTYGWQMPPRSSYPLMSNLAITANEQRMPANYPATHERKTTGNAHEIEESVADYVRAKKFQDDNSEIAGAEDKAETGTGVKSMDELQKLGVQDAQRPQLSLKHQAPADSEPDFVRNYDGSRNRDGVLFNNEPMLSGTETSNFDDADRNWMEAPEDLSVTPKPNVNQKNLDDSSDDDEGRNSGNGPDR